MIQAAWNAINLTGQVCFMARMNSWPATLLHAFWSPLRGIGDAKAKGTVVAVPFAFGVWNGIMQGP